MIYFDNAATTKPFKEVADFMCKFSQENFFNPSGLYEPSLNVTKQINKARESLLKMLNAQNSKVLFTASATEANNFALRCFVNKNQTILISSGEHACIYQTAVYLQQNGFDVKFLKLNSDGTLNLDDLEEKMDERVGLVSIIHASNETGVLNDIEKISKIIKQKNKKTILHCDGVQAFCKIPVDLTKLGVDMYTISSHKVHGPRGAGALIYKNSLSPKPLIFGGGQEYGLRSGTENSASILGFCLASEIMQKNIQKNMEHIKLLKNALWNKLQVLNPILNGDLNNSIPNILSVSFGGIKAEVLVHMLEQRQMYVSTGSSCNSKHSGNRVMMAMNKTKQEEAGNIRISFCEENTLEEVELFAKAIIEDVNKIRELNVWKK